MYIPSYWEQNSVFSDIDICIAGSGIVGLSSALALKRMNKNLKIIVIDRGSLPYGASTRNAGFACFGSISELIDDISKESESEVFDRVERRWKGLNKLRTLLGDQNIGFESWGGYEVFTEDSNCKFEECSGKMIEFNRILHQITGLKETFSLNNEKIKKFGFGNVCGMIMNHFEGQIDTGKMMLSLLSRAISEGIIILNGLTITSITESGAKVELTCEQGYHISAKKCLICTNGFAKYFLDNIQLEPARAQVLITEPIENLPFKGIFHYDLGYYYFRNVGNRVLLGGGRNLDFENENTTDFGLTQKIQNSLEDLLKNVILPKIDHKIEMRWSGIMGMGPSKSPIIKKTGEHTYCAVRLGGMGIAIGSLVGEDAAEMIYNDL